MHVGQQVLKNLKVKFGPAHVCSGCGTEDHPVPLYIEFCYNARYFLSGIFGILYIN